MFFNSKEDIYLTSYSGCHNYAATEYWPTIQYDENGNDNTPILKRVIKEYL